MAGVSKASSSTELLGININIPMLLSPVGSLVYFQTDGALHAAKAAKGKNQSRIAATLSNYSISQIKEESNAD